MFSTFNNMSERNQGIVLVVAGTALLLHTLCVLVPLLKWVVLAGAVYMLVLGLMKLNIQKRVMELMNRKKS